MWKMWLGRVFRWDGLLPLAILMIPFLLRLLFPNQRLVIELASVILPIGGFVIRLLVGRHFIKTNHCARGFQHLQSILLMVGLAIMTLLDCVIILSVLMPKGAVMMNARDVAISAGLYGTYLVLMLVAMYPGRAPVNKPKMGSTETLAEGK